MRIIKFYRYVLTRDRPGRFLRRCVCTAPFGQFRWVRYKLFSWDKESEKCLWKLDARSLRYIRGVNITENKPEEAELWTT